MHSPRRKACLLACLALSFSSASLRHGQPPMRLTIIYLTLAAVLLLPATSPAQWGRWDWSGWDHKRTQRLKAGQANATTEKTPARTSQEKNMALPVPYPEAGVPSEVTIALEPPATPTQPLPSPGQLKVKSLAAERTLRQGPYDMFPQDELRYSLFKNALRRTVKKTASTTNTPKQAPSESPAPSPEKTILPTPATAPKPGPEVILSPTKSAPHPFDPVSLNSTPFGPISSEAAPLLASVEPAPAPEPMRPALPRRYFPEETEHFLETALYDKDVQRLRHDSGYGQPLQAGFLAKWKGDVRFKVVGNPSAQETVFMDEAVAAVNRFLTPGGIRVELNTPAPNSAILLLPTAPGKDRAGYTTPRYKAGVEIIGADILLYRDQLTKAVFLRELLHALGLRGYDFERGPTLLRPDPPPCPKEGTCLPLLDRAALEILYRPELKPGMGMDTVRDIVARLRPVER